MKNITSKSFVLIGILTLSFSSFAQKKEETIRQVKSESSTQSEIKTVKENKTQTVSNGKRRKVLTTEDKIEALESHIQAIDTKVDYINSDENLKNQAIEDNWFDEMQAIREELVTELNMLKSE